MFACKSFLMRLGILSSLLLIPRRTHLYFSQYSFPITMLDNVVQVKKLSAHAVIPSRGSVHAAGFDLSSAYDVVIPKGGKGIVKTDIAIAIPEHTYARIAPRSGLAVKNFIDVGAGVVDYDYRGNVGVVLFNHGEEDFAVSRGDRVAQLILERISMAGAQEVQELSETVRGSGGFGSTGVSSVSDRHSTTGSGDGASLHTLATPTQILDEVLRVKKLTDQAIIPSRGSAHAAGFDLSSAYDIVVPKHGKAIVKTDVSISIPENTYARIAPRSGLAVKNFIDTGAGVVDYDYRGNVGVVLFNHGEEDFAVSRGDRVAQLILERISMAGAEEVQELSETVRGGGGFGSTGVSGVAVTEDTLSEQGSDARPDSPKRPRLLDDQDAASTEVMRVKRLTELATVPTRGSQFAAGFDLSSAYDVVVPKHGKAIVKTDVSISIPENTYARIAPRSGLAVKNFIDVGAGVVDYDYRGNVGVVLFNHGEEDFAVSRGDRVAQLILERISMAGAEEVQELSETVRGSGGFGSTGVQHTTTTSL